MEAGFGVHPLILLVSHGLPFRHIYMAFGERPPRWLKCPRKSAIVRDKFIAFKTFLDDKFRDQVPDEDTFGFPMLHSYVKGNNKVCITLIIIDSYCVAHGQIGQT